MQNNFGGKLFSTHLSSRQIWRVGKALLAIVLAFALAFYAKIAIPFNAPPTLTAEWSVLTFDPYSVGLLLQSVIIPATLLYFFSTTSFFRQIISKDISFRDRLKLFVILATIQLLTQIYQLWLANMMSEPFIWFTPLVMIVIGSLLGGWRVGIGLSFVNILFSGSYELWQAWGFAFNDLFQSGGWRLLLSDPPWKILFLEHYILKMQITSVLWAGIAISFIADLFSFRQNVSLLTAIFLGVGAEFLSAYLTHIAGTPPGLARLMPAALISALTMIIFTLLTRNIYAESTRQRLKIAELARTQAELRALRAQINPHFLFNALNTIRYFVRVDPPNARQLLLDLSELFQRVLHSGNFVPLEDEISYTKAYLALEKARLDERLEVEWIVDETIQLSHPVPTLILQPIVENAVVHGIAPKTEGGKIHIIIKQKAQNLHLRVEDTGVGISDERLAKLLSSTQPEDTIGIHNVDDRLQTLYGENYRLHIQSKLNKGTCVSMKIPIRE